MNITDSCDYQWVCNIEWWIVSHPVDFKIVQCRLSNQRNGRFALSNLRVKGHT